MLYEILEMGRRKKAPPRFIPDSYRVLNLKFPEKYKVLAKTEEVHMPKEQQYKLECRNNPQPIHAKCIKLNTKFLNKPILYMDTDSTKAKQDHWWPSLEPFVAPCPKPPYDKQSTQRSHFQRPACRLIRPLKFNTKRQPSRGIVPLVAPPSPGRLPRIFQEQITFKYDFNARATPCIPYQGKKRGAFVWTKINPEKGESVPEGTRAQPGSGGPELLEEPKAEKGGSAESCVTSAGLRLPDSPEMPPDSNLRLSKADSSAGAKTDPGAPEKGQEGSPGISQAGEVDVGHPSGEKRPLSPPKMGYLEKQQEDQLPPIHEATQSLAEIQKA
ncbi:uncharacterized protein C2orf73 homolog [Zootoca vivipara]|uniref:uncharacterized protein C2orf73 homolog n=1 Tax=Zootoca vivipara TaxID=8524 RepID=UPI00293BD42E|nr:uncharacterized protein C2orf73 homolog [Zootoca vivipara]